MFKPACKAYGIINDSGNVAWLCRLCMHCMNCTLKSFRIQKCCGTKLGFSWKTPRMTLSGLQGEKIKGYKCSSLFPLMSLKYLKCFSRQKLCFAACSSLMSCLWFQVAGRVCEPHWGTKTAGWKNSKEGGEVGAAMSPWSQGVCPQGPRPAEEQPSQWLLHFALILTICGAMCNFTMNYITRAYTCTPFNITFLLCLFQR